MALVQNRNFVVSAALPIDLGANLVGRIIYPVNSNVVAMNGDTNLDLNVPLMRRNVIIFGNVKAAPGNPVADVLVTAYSQSISGLPNVSSSFSGKTDVYGNYSISVPGGTNYQLTFVPPAPQP
jgi:hypothetical protein